MMKLNHKIENPRDALGGACYSYRGKGLTLFTPANMSLLYFSCDQGIEIVPEDFIFVKKSDELMLTGLVFDSNYHQFSKLPFRIVPKNVIDSSFSGDFLLPGLPMSSMYQNDSLPQIRDIWQRASEFISERIPGSRGYKYYQLEEAKQKIQTSHSEIYQILIEARTDLIPELFWHLDNVQSVFSMLCEMYGIEKDDTLTKVAFLHDIGKPAFLVVDHYRYAISLIEEHGIDSLKKMIETGEIDRRRLWKYADEIEQGNIPELPEFGKSFEEYNKDDDIARDLIETLNLDEDVSEMLIKFWLKQLDSKSLYALKIADLLADYYSVLSPQTLNIGIQMKSHAVSTRYDVPYEAVLERSLGYLKGLRSSS